MFETRRKLKQKIADLEYKLSRDTERAAIINGANLPPCKNLTCINCEHVVIYKDMWKCFIVGCGKNGGCPDFKRKQIVLTEKEKQKLQSEIQEQVLS